MDTVVQLLLGALCAFYLLWVAYLAVMNLKRAAQARTIGTTAWLLGLPLVVVAYVLDVVVNWAVMTLALLEWPREWTVTARLKRHCGTATWRGAVARFVCHQLLDTFDPSGRHC